MICVAASVALVLTSSLTAVPPGLASGRTADTVVIHVGSSVVQGDRVQPYTAHWRVTYQTPDGKTIPGGPSRTSSWYDTVTVVSENGRQILHRRQTLYAPDTVLLEVLDNWADRTTIAPLRTELQLRRSPLTTRRYDGTKISGVDPDSASSHGVRPVDVHVSEPVYDFYGGVFDVFLAALPLQPGLVVRFPTDDPTAKEGAGLTWTTIRVIGRERIETDSPRGRLDTWRVEAPAAGGVNGAHFVFWIADQAPYTVRMWYVGPRGGRQVWDITS